jgi:hypothetical protein
MIDHFVELEHCGLPNGNLTKILHNNSHTCALIRIRNVDVKEVETKMETIEAVAEYKAMNS